MQPDTSTLTSTLKEKLYILSQVGNRRVAFADHLISGILLIERSQILPLPFYDEMISGIVHHQGQLLTLVALRHLVQEPLSPMREVFNAVQLSDAAGPGLALIVDHLLGQCDKTQLEAEEVTEFTPQILAPTLWQPRR